MAIVRLVAGGVLAAALAAPEPAHLSVRRKIETIRGDRAAAGAVIAFSPEELNAWARVEIAAQVPEGVRQPRLELAAGGATGFAQVDFPKLGHSAGIETGWFLTRMLEGEKPVAVHVVMVSSAGRATVYLRRVEVGGVAASGVALDFLVRNFLLPRYPEAKIGEPFELGHRIERIDVRPEAARVLIRR